MTKRGIFCRIRPVSGSNSVSDSSSSSNSSIRIASSLCSAGKTSIVSPRTRNVPREHALGRRQAHLLDVLVDRGILLDEEISLRHIGLGLVVVVVADEVFDR